MDKLTLFIFFLALAAPVAQTDWQLIIERDGVRVYTATAKANTQIKPIKVECMFNATPTQLVAVLLDIKSYTGWVYRATSAAVIKQAAPGDLYYYSEVNAPWPAQNRDFVSHITVTQDPGTKVVTVEAVNIPGMIPQKANIYRTNNTKGKWLITPLEHDQLKVVYFLQIDAGGNAPAWLINLFMTDGPLQSFKKLRQQLQKPAYKNAVLPFIKN